MRTPAEGSIGSGRVGERAVIDGATASGAPGDRGAPPEVVRIAKCGDVWIVSVTFLFTPGSFVCASPLTSRSLPRATSAGFPHSTGKP